MREAAVLHTTAEVILIGLHRKVQVVAAILELKWRRLLDNWFATPHTAYAQQPRRLIDGDANAIARCCLRLHQERCRLVTHLQWLTQFTPGIRDKNLCRWRSLRIANQTALIVTEKAEDVWPVEVNGHRPPISIDNFDGLLVE